MKKIIKNTITEMISNCNHTVVFRNLDPICFLEVLKKRDILIRPTLVDSFEVTVAESIFLNVPVIASDVCECQEGTILFKTGNEQDLIDKLEYIIENYNQVKREIIQKKTFSNARKIIDVYKKLFLYGVNNEANNSIL